MARYNSVEIDGVFLTKTGLDGGTPCKVDVTGLVALRPANARINAGQAIDGTPLQQFRSMKGKPIEMTIAVSHEDVFEDIIDAIDTQDAADPNAHNLVIEGHTGNFDLDCVLDEINAPGTFRNGLINEIRLAFRVHTINSITAGS